jgi:alginate O-acetyltransferase complex protein AlgI
MVFSSILFLFFYLPICLLIYRIAPLKLRNMVLLLFSLAFYGWGEPVYILIMVLSILIDYTHGMLVEKYRNNDRRARAIVASSVVFNLALLLFFKYYDFIVTNLSLLPGIDIPPLGLSLPIGISFYTFQTMSYTIDVYRQDAKAQRNLITFGTYVTLFPQLIAGPIVRYKTVAEELTHRDDGVITFASGVERFLVGLSKKVLLANPIGVLWETMSAMPTGELPVVGAWLGLLAFGFQIYFDFSGYSDMAIGLGQMFGFHFLQNFDHPYTSRSITEFWRRWHISLTTWFREYVYIPLGGNRHGRARTIRNLTIVWLLTGFWHGASWNYLFWGMYFLIFMLLERYVFKAQLEKLPSLVRRLYTLVVVFFGWGFFAIENTGKLGAYLGACFGLGGGGIWSAEIGYYLRSYLPLLILLGIGSTPLCQRLWSRLPCRTAVAVPLAIGALLLCTAFLIGSTYNPFLYFRF